jgi:hypothetical protein
MKSIFFILLSFLIFPLPGISQEGGDLVNEIQHERERHSEQVKAIQPFVRKKAPAEPSLFDEKVVKELQLIFKDNPLRKVPHDEVRAMVLEKASGKPPVERFLKNQPRVLNCIVDLLRDEKAMYSALNIFLKKDQLKVYGLIWIFMFIIQWMFKKIFFKKKWGFFKRFILNIFVALVFSVASLSVFYRLFKPELSPTVQIVKRYIFSNRV